MRTASPQPLILYPLTLQYRVFGRLDGVTPAPPYMQPPSSGAPVGVANMLEFDVDNLGLIDLTGRKGDDGQTSDCIVNTTTIYGPNAPSASDTVATSFDGITQRVELSVPLGANGIFSRRCIKVPQSAQLRVNGMEGAPGNPVVVRLSVWRPKTSTELTAMEEACCCLRDCVTELGEPCFTRALFTDTACERAIAGIGPMTVTAGSGEVVLTVVGSGFAADDLFVLIESGGMAVIPVTNVNVLDTNTAKLTVEAPGDQALGAYDLTVAAPLTGGECSATAEAALQIT